MREPARWLPTHAHLRALTIAAGCVLIAVLVRRTDVVVLGVPFIGAAAWGAHHRPRAAPAVEVALTDATVFEGQVTTTTVKTVHADGTETIERDDVTDLAVRRAITQSATVVIVRDDERLEPLGSIAALLRF